MLSRLAFKVEASELKRTFLAVLAFHNSIVVRVDPGLHDCCTNWFKRLFAAADDPLLMEWLPSLIRSPLFDESWQPGPPARSVWPDPMSHFPGLRDIRSVTSQAIAVLGESTDWLIRKTEGETGEARIRALNRLMRLYHNRLLTDEQAARFGDLLWAGTTQGTLPGIPGFAVFGFLHLPAPQEHDVSAAVRRYILALPTMGSVQSAGAGRTVVASDGNRWTLVSEAAMASKPVIQLSDEGSGGIEWTAQEATELYLKARELWINEKPAFAMAGNSPFGLMSSPQENWGRLGQFLARAVIPRIEWSGAQEWHELCEWLSDARKVGVYPSEALPYLLLRQPHEADSVAAVIAGDLDADDDARVAAAAKAVRHWLHLASERGGPDPPEDLLKMLIARVLFRRKPGIRFCLWHLAHLITEMPTSFLLPQVELLARCLLPWHRATALESEDRSVEWAEAERPELRVRLAYLAASLRTWYARENSEYPEPEGIAKWQNWCASDPLPEIQRAFVSWANVLVR